MQESDGDDGDVGEKEGGEGRGGREGDRSVLSISPLQQGKLKLIMESVIHLSACSSSAFGGSRP